MALIPGVDVGPAWPIPVDPNAVAGSSCIGAQNDIPAATSPFTLKPNAVTPEPISLDVVPTRLTTADPPAVPAPDISLAPASIDHADAGAPAAPSPTVSPKLPPGDTANKV